jgi:hypothetical protein
MMVLGRAIRYRPLGMGSPQWNTDIDPPAAYSAPGNCLNKVGLESSGESENPEDGGRSGQAEFAGRVVSGLLGHFAAWEE